MGIWNPLVIPNIDALNGEGAAINAQSSIFPFHMKNHCTMLAIKNPLEEMQNISVEYRG
jgi:hypothetical protein